MISHDLHPHARRARATLPGSRSSVSPVSYVISWAGCCAARNGGRNDQMQTLIQAGLLIDGLGREPVLDASLVVEGGRIVEIRGSQPRLKGLEVLDYGDKVVLPGLI